MKQPFRVHVKQLGSGYLAEIESMSICVGGSSAAEAAEKARELAIDIFTRYLREALPTTLVARIERGEHVAFVMRPFDEPFSVTAGVLAT